MARNSTPGLIRRNGNIWHYNITVEGVRYQGSTRTVDLKTATLFLGQLRLDIARGKLALKDSRTPMLLEEVYREFLTNKRFVASTPYLASVSAHWRIWIEPRIGKKVLDEITCSEIDGLRNDLLKAGRSQVFTNNVLVTLRTLLNLALKRGRVRKVARVELLRIQRKPRPLILGSLVLTFLATFDQKTSNPQSRVMVRVMLGLGCRSSEAIGMRWNWIDPDLMTYTVGKAKGKEARVLPIPRWLWDALHSLPKDHPSGLVFPAKNGQHHSPGFLRKPLLATAKKLGLGKLTQHRLRATFATLHAQVGTPITEIQAMLGHKNITTTMVYIESDLESKRRAQDALSDKFGIAKNQSPLSPFASTPEVGPLIKRHHQPISL